MDTKELFVTAELAHIKLADCEVKRLEAAVTQMLEYFGQMDKIDVEGLEPTSHVLLKENRLRRDEQRPSSITENLLENAPDIEDRFFVIPNVL